MIYVRAVFPDGTEALRECLTDGVVMRYCDTSGADLTAPSGYPELYEQVFPEWAQPDPAPELIVEAPPTRRTISKLAYMRRFTSAELATVITAAKTDVQVEVWLEKFKVAEDIDLDDPDTREGVHALEAFGLIGEGRAGEILNA